MSPAPPDVTFNVEAGSLGTNVTAKPSLGIARKLGGRDPWQTTHGGILVPNPYFIGVSKSRGPTRDTAYRVPRFFNSW